ncbi:hypothetical protein CGCSCA4_v011730 [Colletotrichum siamense]|uniref:Uncharacterized protein n=1 Tax=Colletotrichum siamense TaxID=690259 RepID=A0A9P5BVK1_COLSI|nr:hypothetical protein CGCSCA4_v011730 [Colletotrichum siamense]KAF4851503.1 hypothetical protein CGCSCA2_v010992 [Colletotrichum siamense]
MTQSKADKINEVQQNLPLPEQPPVASDWQSADARNVNVGSGGDAERKIGTETAATSGLREPASKAAEDLSSNDLGIGRVEELPLDNTKREHHDRLRPRRPVVPTQTSESLQGYLNLAKTGLDDDEAKGVQNLSDLGGPSSYRASGGPSQDYVPKPRPANDAYAGMKTSPNGILLPPGAEFRIFNKASGNGAGTNVLVQAVGGSEQTYATQATSSQATGATQVTSAMSSQGASVTFKGSQHYPGRGSTSALPPHLRKKPAEGDSSPSSAQTTQSTQADKQPAQPAQSTQTVSPALSTPPAQTAQAAKIQTPIAAVAPPTTKASLPSEGRMEHEHSKANDSALPSDRQLFSSTCKGKIGGPGGSWEDVIVKLKVVFTENRPEGHAMFVMEYKDILTKSHGLETYRCVYAKGVLVICSFIDSSNDKPREERYSFRFPDESTGVEFNLQCDNIKRVMEYILKHAIPAKSEAVEPSAKQEAEAESLPETPSEKTAVGTPTPEPVSKMVAAPKTDVDKNASKTTGLEDAFDKLALDKVKGSSMYTAERTAERRQYSAEQLLERRSSAEMPPGIKDVKIPLQKDQGGRLPPHLHSNRRQESSADLHAKAKLHQEWLSGNKTTADLHQESVVSQEVPVTASTVAPVGKSDTLVEVEINNQMVQTPIKEAPIFQESEPAQEAPMQKPEITEASAADESLISFKTSKSEVDSAVSMQPTSTAPTVEDETLNTSLSQEGGTAVSMAESTAKQTDAATATDNSEQPTPVMPPAQATPHPGYIHGVQGMPPQMPTPIMGSPHMAGPAIYHPYGAQQIIESAMQQHLPANGVLHAISVTYHVSQGPSSAQQNGGHQPAPTMYNMTQQLNTSTGFSPRAQVFQPVVQGQTVNSNGPKMRRGLESSRFATGFSGAKYAGSFTGIAADE